MALLSRKAEVLVASRAASAENVWDFILLFRGKEDRVVRKSKERGVVYGGLGVVK